MFIFSIPSAARLAVEESSSSTCFLQPFKFNPSAALRNLFIIIYMFFAAFFAAQGIRYYSTKSSVDCNPLPGYGEKLVLLRNLAFASLASSWLTAEAVHLKLDFFSWLMKLKFLRGGRRRKHEQFRPMFLFILTIVFSIAGAGLIIAYLILVAQINAAELACEESRLTVAAALVISFRLIGSVFVGVLVYIPLLFAYPSIIFNLPLSCADFEDEDDGTLCSAV